jgi:CRISPR-associated exonuclease Cas4
MSLGDLRDRAARVRALTDFGSTLLVEAGAGTGKTSLMAGRVAMLLANGEDPRSIAAITFTDLAASALDARVHRYVTTLLAGRIPDTLQLAFPDGLSDQQKAALKSVSTRLGQLTIVTIHSFCQTIISSYAIEADIDPGARMLDADQAGTFFGTVFDAWIKKRFRRVATPDDPIAALSRHDPRRVVDLLRQFADFRRKHREASTLGDELDGRPDVELDDAVAAFRRWINSIGKAPQKTSRLLEELERLAAFFSGNFETKPNFERLWSLAHDVPVLECMGRQPPWKQAELQWPKHKGEWEYISRSDGARLHDEAHALFSAVAGCYGRMMGRIATAIVGRLADDLDEIIKDYDNAKRGAALLDFDDLLIKARDLVQGHDEVRQKLGERYKYLFVDEFQDTDPIQAEIIFAIGAETRAGAWNENRLRAGALFLVGDPKQSIYRFRGADLACYMKARDAIERRWPVNILKITENFRSRHGILSFVNDRFVAPLQAAGLQYEDLTSTREEPAHGLPIVSKLAITAPFGVAALRDAEAEAVADLCVRLIGNIEVRDGDRLVPLSPGGIALLSPQSTELWRYERALEARGLPIATQAGKGFFRRQEVQDLLCLARTLADARDYLAFGALMRGPLVGLTDEELLDVVGSLPASAEEPDAIPRFSLMTDAEHVSHPLARSTLETLKALQRKALGTTPGLLLAEAVERLNVRAILAARDADDSGRAIANLELFLEKARRYRVRGLEQFVRDFTDEWSQKYNGQVEGQIDADGSAINVITIHSAKGLEWPVVIPINACTGFGRRPSLLHRPSDGTLHWIINDVASPSIADARETFEAEHQLERERMWYVTCTRAEELLIIPEIPRFQFPTWSGVIDLNIGSLPKFPVDQLKPIDRRSPVEPPNEQTAEAFEGEFATFMARSMPLSWQRPSERDTDRAPIVDAVMIEEGDVPEAMVPIGAGRIRGLVLHKLIEEVLTGELLEERTALEARAGELVAQLEVEAEDAAKSPGAGELAATVLKTLALPDIASLRSSLVAELPIYAAPDPWTAIAGRVDALATDPDGTPIVIDWKSDVAPTEATIQDHAGQLRDYCRVVNARRGALVYMTHGIVRWITPEAA